MIRRISWPIMASDVCPVAVYDACVLYPFHLRNLLIQCAVDGLVRAKWTDAIHDEWIRAVATRGIPRERLLRTRDLMKAVLPDASVDNYARHIPELSLPDANDRHVLAAAIEAGASTIVTWNVRHFPDSQMNTYGIQACDPDSLLARLFRSGPEAVTAVVDSARSNLRRSAPEFDEYLEALRQQGLEQFVALLRT